jgi:membrane protease YdiL (CAAX protease family)
VLTPLDHVVMAVLVVLIPPRAWMSFRRLNAASPDARRRLRPQLYFFAMLSQWIISGVVLTAWITNRRPWAWLGVIPVFTYAALGIAIGVALIVTLMALRSRGADRETMMARARARLAHVEAMLPHTAHELRLFSGLSITAGVCEELLFRGFMIWYLQHWLGLIPAAIVSSVFFGFGHLYQGLKGVLQTGLVGAFMATVYLVSGSLVLPMLIHALMDLYAGYVGYQLVGDGAESQPA